VGESNGEVVADSAESSATESTTAENV